MKKKRKRRERHGHIEYSRHFYENVSVLRRIRLSSQISLFLNGMHSSDGFLL